MSAVFLGVDTSNYTTSLALFDRESNKMKAERRLLPVPEGGLGLRQSDALFHHTKALPDLLNTLLAGETLCQVSAVGVSARPRDVEGSYMPCFLAGHALAHSLGHSLGVPVFDMSHQAGHLAAGLWSQGHTDWFDRPFLSCHVSGGTTELLYTEPVSERGLTVTNIGGTSDLTAGQLIDRVGHMLGLSFPAGAALETLAEGARPAKSHRVGVRACVFSLSGLQNKAEALFRQGTSVGEIAFFVLDAIGQALFEALRQAADSYPGLPLLCVGGVMENRYLQQLLAPLGAVFARPGYSSDNAAGVAVLASRRYAGETS